MMLATAALNAPLVGLNRDDLTLAHRVNLDGLPATRWETASSATAVCGTQVQLIEVRWPDLRTRGTTVRRCPTCRGWRP